MSQITATTEQAYNAETGLTLARPDKRFVPSYIAALQEGMKSARHKTATEEINALENPSDETWAMFAQTCPNSTGTPNFCMEDMFWLTKGDLFIGFVSLRKEMAEDRAKYGGNTGREFRPTERNKGYGTQSISLLMAIAQQRGLPYLEMATAQDNIAAQRPWEKHGAKRIGEFVRAGYDYPEDKGVKYRLELVV